MQKKKRVGDKKLSYFSALQKLDMLIVSDLVVCFIKTTQLNIYAHTHKTGYAESLVQVKQWLLLVVFGFLCGLMDMKRKALFVLAVIQQSKVV